MPQFITQGGNIGSLNNPALRNGAIPNALATAELDTAILTDPVKIVAFKTSIAGQMNAQSAGPKFSDLSERIAGIKIETSAQGAGMLVVDLIDPLWVIPMSGFIQVDNNGYLWPPIDINFPSKTDCWFRLCQYRAVWDADMDGPNLTLTFEDRIAALLREMNALDGLSQGQPNQTLGGFFKQLVDNANQVLKPPQPIRLVELIDPKDPNYQVPINDIPQSAQSPLRQNPNKTQQGLDASQQAVLDGIDRIMKNIFPDPSGSAGTVRDAEHQVAQGWDSLQKQLRSLFAPASASNPFGASASNPFGIDQAGFGNNP